jgi:hypothetical protein
MASITAKIIEERLPRAKDNLKALQEGPQLFKNENTKLEKELIEDMEFLIAAASQNIELWKLAKAVQGYITAKDSSGIIEGSKRVGKLLSGLIKLNSSKP